MKLEQYLTAKRFRAWLESKDPSTRVGKPGSCPRCPLARFLMDTIPGVTAVSVAGSTEISRQLRSGEKTQFISAPGWARDFITAVDRIETGEVRARKALALLDEITAKAV